MVILDSNIWIAFFNKADSQHAKAKKVLQKNNNKLVITEYILLEVASVLCLRSKKLVADKFLEMATNNKDIEVLASSEIFLNKIVSEFFKHKTKYLSFVDISLVHLSGRYEIVTFDKKLDRVING